MKKLLSFLLTLFLGLFLLTPQASAKILVEKQGTASVGADQVIDDDLFISGEQVSIEGTVNGDVYAAGSQITINANIQGDVIAAGGIITLSGTVGEDVRMVGGNIIIKEAEIADSITLAGGNLTLDRNTTVGGGALFAGGTLNSDAQIGRNLMAGAGTATLNSKIDKNVYIGSGQLTLNSQTEIGGNLTHQTEEDANISDSAVINGNVTKKSLPATPNVNKEKISNLAQKFAWGARIWSYLSALAVGTLMLYFLPKFSNQITSTIKQKTITSIGWGLLALFLTFPALLLLLFTGIGIPLTFILGAFFAIYLYLSKLFVGMALGEWIVKGLEKKANKYLVFVLGLLVFYTLKALPIIGAFASIIGLLLGLGAIYRYHWQTLTNRE